jgi:wyosine [tRNA(Phe)-imidazoG37] synthetase (radical SAM superfamily)
MSLAKLRNREHDFSSKLRQGSTVRRLKEYIQWRRDLQGNPTSIEPPVHSPISINLDLTSACNYSCPFCVDAKLINAGKTLALEEVKKLTDTLRPHGLLSVILIGGGEPTLHPDFEAVVAFMKDKGLQIGIVTNGSRLEKIEAIADRLEEKDWIRISIDAAREETFQALHRPRTKLTLHQILEKAKKVKKKNSRVSLGYSYVILWEGVDIGGKRLSPNIREMSRAAELAGKFSFDYISFKPCLVRVEDSQRETLLKNVGSSKESQISEEMESQLQRAREVAGNDVKILESPNLKAILNQQTERIKTQPKRCHVQFFRTVVSPFGIYHCPAFRGVDIAKISEKDGYLTDKNFRQSLKRLARSIETFDATTECKDVGCFYNETNWWLERLIQSRENVHEIEKIEDDNFFL